MKYISLLALALSFFITTAGAQEDLGQIGNKRFSCVVSKSGQLKVNWAVYESAQAAMDQDNQDSKNTQIQSQRLVQLNKLQRMKSTRNQVTVARILDREAKPLASGSVPGTVENVLAENSDFYAGNRGRAKLERQYNKLLNSGGLKETAPLYDEWKSLTVQEALDSLEENVRSRSEIRDAYNALNREIRTCRGCALKRELRNDGTLRRLTRRKQRKRRCGCKEVEKPASLVIESGDFGQCACYNVAFVQWERNLTKKASSVTAVIDWVGGGAVERPTTGSDPFDNSLSLGESEPTLAAPSGSNWIKVADNYSADFNLDRCAPDCGTGLTNLMAFIQNPRIRIDCN